MSKIINKIHAAIKETFNRNKFLEEQTHTSNIRSKLNLQIIVSCAFLILTIANVISKSYDMMFFTLAGCIVNVISAVVARKSGRMDLCAYSSIITCSILFGFFVVYGGNDGFSCLWVVLLPFLSMVVMNFTFGLCASAFFQVFLIVVFWTPVRDMLYYQYNEQFCLRFPLFFFVTFILGLFLTISLQWSRYNECKHLQELEEMTEVARNLARLDPLTELANRRCAYEDFKLRFADSQKPRCIVMGDIDCFKAINDSYGHDFGDEVLVVLSQYMRQLLPEGYLKSRWGGEEFLFAADEPLKKVYERIENLRKVISQHQFTCNGKLIRVTITFGIAEYIGEGELENAINIADNRLYAGKKASRNCTVIE